MYLLGVLCLVAITTALPVIPEPPVLPGQGDVTVHDSVLHTNLPINEDAQKGEHEEKKDENEAEPPKEIVLLSIPEPPILPPLDESFVVELIKQEEKDENKVDKDSKQEDAEADKDKGNKQTSSPIPAFISNFITTIGQNIKWPPTIPSINWPSSISSINWPFKLPTIFSRSPRIIYPGYDYVIETIE